MDGRSRRLIALFAVVVLAWLAGCSYAVPDVCGSACHVDVIADEHGYNVSIAQERVTIDVRADGSARWTVRLDLTGPGVSRLQADPSAAHSIARSAFDEPSFSAAPASPQNLTSRFEGRTFVIAYDDPGLAHRSVGGVVVVDRFNREPAGSLGGYDVDADAVVLRGPDGTVVANRPPNGAVEGSSVTYRDYVARKTYVVFAPDRTTRWRWAAELAVFLEALGWTLVPTVVGAVPAAGLLVGVGTLLLYEPGADRDLYADLRAGRWWALAVLVAIALATVALTTGSPTFGGIDLIGWLILASPAVVLGVLGAVAHRGPRVRTVGLVVLAGLAVAVSFGSVLEGGNGLGSALVFASLWAVGGVLVGAPAFLGVRRYVVFLQGLD